VLLQDHQNSFEVFEKSFAEIEGRGTSRCLSFWSTKNPESSSRLFNLMLIGGAGTAGGGSSSSRVGTLTVTLQWCLRTVEGVNGMSDNCASSRLKSDDVKRFTSTEISGSPW
jgi:hypothetical protein